MRRTATASPDGAGGYTATWSTSQTGIFDIIAKVTDTAGTPAFSAPVTVTVKPISLNVTSHIDGQGVYSGSVVISGNVSCVNSNA